MSGRGGRGGRGGYNKPPSGAQLYLKRSAQEAGLDDRNLKSLQDLTKPRALFPDLTWHSNGTIRTKEDEEDYIIEATATKRSSSTVYLIQKGRDIRSRMQTQYQVRPTQEQDVKRYEAKDQQQDSFNVVKSPSDAAERLGSAYVPQELLPSAAAKKKASSSLEKGAAAGSNKKNPANLTDLEEKELKRRTDAEQEEEAAALELGLEPSDDEEESADYTMNYYESEGDESDAGGGDGGEPTF